MSTDERICSKVVNKTGKSSPLSKRNFQEQWTDDLHPLKRAFDQIVERATPEIAAILKENVNFYELARGSFAAWAVWRI